MVGRRSPQTPSINRLTSLPELGTLKMPEIASRRIPTHQATAPLNGRPWHTCREDHGAHLFAFPLGSSIEAFWSA